MDLTAEVIEAIVATIQVLGLALIAAWAKQTHDTVNSNSDKIDKLNGGRQ